MIRALAFIVAAIHLSAPNLSRPTATAYARTIQREAKARHFDPVTVIAMVHHESHWNARIVNRIGCVGLGQICLTNYPYCRADMQSSRCRAKLAQLQSGQYNLRVVAGMITGARAFCRRKTGRQALFRRWLASYQGLNSVSRHRWCGLDRKGGKWVEAPTHRITRRVISLRLKLIRDVEKGKGRKW